MTTEGFGVSFCGDWSDDDFSDFLKQLSEPSGDIEQEPSSHHVEIHHENFLRASDPSHSQAQYLHQQQNPHQEYGELRAALLPASSTDAGVWVQNVPAPAAAQPQLALPAPAPAITPPNAATAAFGYAASTSNTTAIVPIAAYAADSILSQHFQPQPSSSSGAQMGLSSSSDYPRFMSAAQRYPHLPQAPVLQDHMDGASNAQAAATVVIATHVTDAVAEATAPAQRTDLANELGLKPDGAQKENTLRRIGEILLAIERSGDISQLKTRFDDQGRDPSQQYAFWAVGGRLENERSNLCGPQASRRVVQVSDGSVFVACLSGSRCTCSVTYCDACHKEGHPYDKVCKYFLAYRDKPSGCNATQKLFKPDRCLWVPEEPPPRAVLWHVKPRVLDPAAAASRRRGRNNNQLRQVDSPKAVVAPWTAPAAPATDGLFILANPMSPVAMAGTGTSTSTSAGAIQCSLEVVKRPRIAVPDSAVAVPVTPMLQHALHTQQHTLRQWSLAVQDPWIPGPHPSERDRVRIRELTEPWRNSLQRIAEYLISCHTAAAAATAGSSLAVVPAIFRPSSADFNQLLADIPVEHLISMRRPETGESLAHMLVTPPGCLWSRDGQSGGAHPVDPNEDLSEIEALGFIMAFLSRLASEPGGSWESAARTWSDMLAVADSKYGATAIHRAGQYGHRLRVLQEGVLPYASRAALLHPTSHIYLCCHSACRSGRGEAATLLVDAIATSLADIAMEPQLRPLLHNVIPLTSGSGYGIGSCGTADAANIKAVLQSRVFYDLKNKFFQGTNKPEEGYVSPPGETGTKLLSGSCARIWRDGDRHTAGTAGTAFSTAAAAPSSLPYYSGASGSGQVLSEPFSPMFTQPPSPLPSSSSSSSLLPQPQPHYNYYPYGPVLPLPSPPPADKKRMAALLGGVKAVAGLLDVRQPGQWWLQQQPAPAP